MRLDIVTPVLAAALRQGALGPEAPSAIFYELAAFRAAIAAVRAAFPAGALHTLAVKANPLSGMLREARRCGMGAECASLPELQHALRLGFAPSGIVYDAPAKTWSELTFAVEQGVFVNVDNWQELERLAALAESGRLVRAGIRVNPQTGVGSYAGTSTAAATSKFGIPLLEDRARLIDAFRRFPWLVGLHVHTGSQVCPLELVIRGVAAIVELASAIERDGGRMLEALDIGGGLPVNYASDDVGSLLTEYAKGLVAAVPEVARYRLVTEFGRAVNAKAGWAVSRVEYTKQAGGRRTAVVHLGADFMLRTAYVPEVWTHRVTIHDSNGAPKVGASAIQDIAGPLCFSGDLIAREQNLPLAEPGDYVVIHDVGAYTYSMWSRYNSRQAPAAYACERNGNTIDLRLLKAAESPDDVLRFWGS